MPFPESKFKNRAERNMVGEFCLSIATIRASDFTAGGGCLGTDMGHSRSVAAAQKQSGLGAGSCL